MKPKEKKPEGGGGRAQVSCLTNIQANFSAKSTAPEAQRERVLRALRQGPQTTESLRRMGVFQVASRIKELRDKQSCDIETHLVTLRDRDGFEHRGVARYVLREVPGWGR